MHCLIVQRPPVADFLAKNRKAAKNVKLKASTVKDNKRGFVKPEARIAKPAASGKKAGSNAKVEAPPSCNGDGEGSVGGGTVIISKDYLDSLLQMTVVRQEGGREEEAIKQTRAKTESESHPFHHTSSIPANTYQQSHTQPQEQLGEHTAPQVSVLPAGRTTGGTDRRGKTLSPALTEYFPFGRPGCGAPLRTVSGHVMADLRGGGYNPHHPPTSIHHPRPLSPSTHHMTQGGGHLGQTGSNAHGVTTSHIPGSRGTEVVEGSSPRYARGAWPCVNHHTLSERAAKRRRELEHMVNLLCMFAGILP